MWGLGLWQVRACLFLQHAGPAGLVQPHRQQNRALQAPGGPQHAGDVPWPASPCLTVPTGLLWGAPCTELGFLGEARVSPHVGSDSLDAGRACTGAGFPGAAQSWWPGDPGWASGLHVWTRQGGERGRGTRPGMLGHRAQGARGSGLCWPRGPVMEPTLIRWPCPPDGTAGAPAVKVHRGGGAADDTHAAKDGRAGQGGAPGMCWGQDGGALDALGLGWGCPRCAGVGMGAPQMCWGWGGTQDVLGSGECPGRAGVGGAPGMW